MVVGRSLATKVDIVGGWVDKKPSHKLIMKEIPRGFPTHSPNIYLVCVRACMQGCLQWHLLHLPGLLLWVCLCLCISTLWSWPSTVVQMVGKPVSFLFEGLHYINAL